MCAVSCQPVAWRQIRGTVMYHQCVRNELCCYPSSVLIEQHPRPVTEGRCFLPCKAAAGCATACRCSADIHANSYIYISRTHV